MAQVEIVIEVRGIWCFKICLWLTHVYFLALKLVRLFLPRASRNTGKKLIFVDFVPTMREVI